MISFRATTLVPRYCSRPSSAPIRALLSPMDSSVSTMNSGCPVNPPMVLIRSIQVVCSTCMTSKGMVIRTGSSSLGRMNM